MIKFMYAIRDEAAEVFLDPMIDQTDETAKRNFAYALKNNQMMGFRPSDFSLWQIAVYDSTSGSIEPLQSIKLLMRGNDYAEK